MENRRKSPSIMDNMTEEEKNELIGSAIDAWLEKKWAVLGKYTARGIAAFVFSYLMYVMATHAGWSK